MLLDVYCLTKNTLIKMLRSTVIILFLVCINLYTCVPIEAKVDKPKTLFRNDYTCIETTQSLYKIHNIGRNWLDAKKTCSIEGATFFYPENTTEAMAVMDLMNKIYPNIAIVYIGISDLLSKGVFVTIDGKSVDDVFNHWSNGEPNDVGGIEDCVILTRDLTLNDDSCQKKFPFICKKTLAKITRNELCDTYDTKYLYKDGLGKCYKFHTKPMTWSDAYATCNAEQSYLAVINSKQEAEHFIKLIKSNDKETTEKQINEIGHLHLGFHNVYNDGWTTVQGISIEESGYSEWASLQTDNANSKNKNCGSMLYNGLLSDVGCNDVNYFICEHDIDTLKMPVDEGISKVANIQDIKIA